MGSSAFEVYLLNTGRVGGTDADPGSKKIAIEDSGAIVRAIAERTISWETDPDFGYEVATSLTGVQDVEKLQPRRLYQRVGRAAEHATWVDRFRRERIEFLDRYPGLRAEIVRAIS
jgi:phosphoenolpyruvate carboxykinase (ATP)